MLLLSLFLILLSCESTYNDYKCLMTRHPYLSDFNSQTYLEDGEFRVSFSYPILNKKTKNVKQVGDSGIVKENHPGDLDGTMTVKRTSSCSFEAFTNIPTSPLEYVSGVQYLSFQYNNAQFFPFEYNFVYDYQIKHTVNAIPKSSTIDIALFQVTDFFESQDESTNRKTYHWIIEVQHYGDVEVFFRGLLSERLANSSILRRGYDKYDNTITYMEIVAQYDLDEVFESETCFFQFQKWGDRNFIDHIVDLTTIHTGFVTVYPKSVHKESQKYSKSNLILATQTMEVSSRNETFTTLAISSEDSLTVRNRVLLSQQKRSSVSKFKARMEHLKMICANCETPRDYIFEYSCSSLVSEGCITHTSNDHTNEYTLVVRNLDPGTYRVISRFSFTAKEQGVEREGIVETFSHIVVSPYKSSAELLRALLFLPIFLSVTGGFGVGLYVLRLLEKKYSRGTKFYKIGKKAVDVNTGKEFIKLDLEYKLRHKDIEFRPEDMKSIKKRFPELFRLQKASKYTPYVHCKHCYLEQQNIPRTESESCIKCGLPIVHFVEFSFEDRFCVICSLMNKYQPRPHGRCILHLSSSKRRPRLKQGSVYVLYRDHYSVGSASRQMKKSNKNDWIERVTVEEVWKLNSLIRFEYLWLLKDLFRKPLKCDDDSLDCLKFTIRKITDRISNVGPNMRSEHFRRLKIENLSGFSSENLSKFYDSFRRLLTQLVMVMNMNLRFYKSQKKRMEKKRKRDLVGNGQMHMPSIILKKARGNQNQVIRVKREIQYEPETYLGILDTSNMIVQQQQQDNRRKRIIIPSSERRRINGIKKEFNEDEDIDDDDIDMNVTIRRTSSSSSSSTSSSRRRRRRRGSPQPQNSPNEEIITTKQQPPPLPRRRNRNRNNDNNNMSTSPNNIKVPTPPLQESTKTVSRNNNNVNSIDSPQSTTTDSPNNNGSDHHHHHPHHHHSYPSSTSTSKKKKKNTPPPRPSLSIQKKNNSNNKRNIKKSTTTTTRSTTMNQINNIHRRKDLSEETKRLIEKALLIQEKQNMEKQKQRLIREQNKKKLEQQQQQQEKIKMFNSIKQKISNNMSKYGQNIKFNNFRLKSRLKSSVGAGSLFSRIIHKKQQQQIIQKIIPPPPPPPPPSTTIKNDNNMKIDQHFDISSFLFTSPPPGLQQETYSPNNMAPYSPNGTLSDTSAEENDKSPTKNNNNNFIDYDDDINFLPPLRDNNIDNDNNDDIIVDNGDMSIDDNSNNNNNDEDDDDDDDDIIEPVESPPPPNYNSSYFNNNSKSTDLFSDLVNLQLQSTKKEEYNIQERNNNKQQLHQNKSDSDVYITIPAPSSAEEEDDDRKNNKSDMFFMDQQQSSAMYFLPQMFNNNNNNQPLIYNLQQQQQQRNLPPIPPPPPPQQQQNNIQNVMNSNNNSFLESSTSLNNNNNLYYNHFENMSSGHHHDDNDGSQDNILINNNNNVLEEEEEEEPPEFDVDEYISSLTINDVAITVDELSINSSHDGSEKNDFFY